eukprot:gb/GECG01001104.1/.p1 GENE.gb/GECG01001104.1/~~gb/GECG01001104.1/.p1  ORF type:complete len:250 (+),score=16.91 gb/GECG01001104.1/:1-750(+)
MRFWKETTDTQLQGRPAVFYCWISMKVMVTENIATSLGIYNGTTGNIVGFIWQSDSKNTEPRPFTLPEGTQQTHFTSVHYAAQPPQAILIKLQGSCSKQLRQAVTLTGLPDDVFPVFPTKRLVKAPIPTKTLKATMWKFPMICADAITIHKLQGKTIESPLLVTSLSNLSTASAYTAITRLRTIDQLYISDAINKRSIYNWKSSKRLAAATHSLQESSIELLSSFLKQDARLLPATIAKSAGIGDAHKL